MRQTILRIAAGILVGLGTGGPQLYAADRTAGSCWADGDEGRLAASHIKQLIIRRDSTYLSKLGLLPADPSSVALTTDSATCDAALSAYNAYISTKAVQPVTAVIVVKAGTERFAVVNPAVTLGEFNYYTIFDANWIFVHEFAGCCVTSLNRP